MDLGLVITLDRRGFCRRGLVGKAVNSFDSKWEGDGRSDEWLIMRPTGRGVREGVAVS